MACIFTAFSVWVEFDNKKSEPKEIKNNSVEISKKNTPESQVDKTQDQESQSDEKTLPIHKKIYL